MHCQGLSSSSKTQYNTFATFNKPKFIINLLVQCLGSPEYKPGIIESSSKLVFFLVSYPLSQLSWKVFSPCILYNSQTIQSQYEQNATLCLNSVYRQTLQNVFVCSLRAATWFRSGEFIRMSNNSFIYYTVLNSVCVRKFRVSSDGMWEEKGEFGVEAFSFQIWRGIPAIFLWRQLIRASFIHLISFLLLFV